LALGAAFGASTPAGATGALGSGPVQHVLLISIDGMHAVDFANCLLGVSGANSGAPYCPNMAALAQHGVSYTQAFTTKPSDSFPGLVSLITGATPFSTGTFYDVSYDRSLSPPAQTTPYGIAGGASLCPSVVGTQVGFDEEIDFNYQLLNGGGGINPAYLPRDPNNGCAPVYPHQYIRVNTIFEVVKAAGGYTAWTDKHPSYDFTNGISGQGVDDLYTPEINSIPVALPQVTLMPCAPLPDPAAATSNNSWTDSFANIRCYDSLKVQATLNQINGMNHAGTAPAPVPALFGMNFQAVSVGEKLVENSTVGGYVDGAGAPSPSLLSEIEYVDNSIGMMVSQLQNRGLLNQTAIVITAKHGQSPIDIKRLLRIPGDNANDQPPSMILSPAGVGLGLPVAQADEDDISMLWLTDDSKAAIRAAVAQLEQSAATIGADGGEIFYEKNLTRMFKGPSNDPRTPDIIVAPNVGVVYTGGQGKVAEHGGFANDDRNIIMLVYNPLIVSPTTIRTPVETTQVAPTILNLLGLDPTALIGAQAEGTQLLPGINIP
jgi:hypothetical protein